jgi:Tol biopolymer transport system component
VQAEAPDWSPDGEGIVFVDSDCGLCPASDVFVMNPAGRSVRQLTRDFGNNLFPHFSPNGRKITFTHEDPPSDFTHAEIYTMNADGTGRVNLTNTPDANEFGSDWQPVAENDDDH